ncbi:MAG: hypothetical protein AAB036_06325 [Elusimicrobiota bacterium]
MTSAFALGLMLAACRTAAGPTGAGDPQAAPATGFPASYLAMVEASLQADSSFGTRLLDGLEMHLRSVAAMTSPQAAADYLEITVLGEGMLSSLELRSSLGKKPMESQPASALLLAHALARPAQFQELLEGLESRRTGLGKNAARLLRETKGSGDKRLIARLRGQAEPSAQAVASDHRFGKLEPLFDAASVEGAPILRHTRRPPNVPAPN